MKITTTSVTSATSWGEYLCRKMGLFVFFFHAAVAAETTDFIMFDLIAADGKPENLPFTQMHMVYQWAGYGGPHTSNEDKDYSRPPYEYFKCCYVKNNFKNDIPHYVSIDFEQWVHDKRVSDSTFQQNLTYYLETLEMVHGAFTGTKVGWYNLGASPLLNSKILANKATIKEYLAWQRDNDRIMPLMGQVDFVQPSLYMHSTYTLDGWKRKAEAYVSEARRLAPDKPVYAHLSPQWIDRPPKFIDGPLWGEMLRWSYDNADGLVIWMFPMVKFLTTWDENADWWLETKRFIAKHDINPDSGME